MILPRLTRSQIFGLTRAYAGIWGGVVAKTDLQLKCWGIVIRCNQTGVNYDMLSPQEWSVTAIEAEENWQQCLEMHLEKNHAAN
jgi:hypothetical protein